MTISALVLEESPVRLWGLTSSRRLQRQAAEMGGIDWCTSTGALPDSGLVLLLNGHFLFEIRTLRGLVASPNSILVAEPDQKAAAALVDASQIDAVIKLVKNAATVEADTLPPGISCIDVSLIGAFDESLRSARVPLLELIDENRRRELENELYGNAYRGITDLVTKFVWPRPARQAVHLCARLGLSPNTVTTIGLMLVLAACWLFLNGHYAAGLVAGWLMTFLDTVDGKLARVTIQSSPFGHIYDHAIDLVHPPFWYIFWGMSLVDFQPVFGFDLPAMGWWLVAGYVVGRLVEGLFPLLGHCSVFTWRPFDAWFRLVTARRNPCLIILTLSVLAGHPDWGFVGVVLWTVLTTGILVLRFLQGLLTWLTRGPLVSWLDNPDSGGNQFARSWRIFGGTRAAYEG